MSYAVIALAISVLAFLVAFKALGRAVRVERRMWVMTLIQTGQITPEQAMHIENVSSCPDDIKAIAMANTRLKEGKGATGTGDDGARSSAAANDQPHQHPDQEAQPAGGSGVGH